MTKSKTRPGSAADSARLRESLAAIRSRTKQHPTIGIILGSGLGEFAGILDAAITINTSDIPHYPHSTVKGHRGRLVFGTVRRVPVLAFQGRVHFYETGELETVLYPIRVAHALGIKTLIVTNAAGGVNRSFEPGDLMLILDQMNLTFENPLRTLRTPRTKMHRDLYDLDLQELIVNTACTLDVRLRKGVYCGVKGPSYETAAEVRMVGKLGGDAVGMSTINEVAFAASLGMRVAGISCITNLATGIGNEKLSHSEVTVVANRVKSSFTSLLQGAVTAIGSTRHS